MMLHVCLDRAELDYERLPLLSQEQSPRRPRPSLSITTNKDCACSMAKVEYIHVDVGYRFLDQ